MEERIRMLRFRWFAPVVGLLACAACAAPVALANHSDGQGRSFTTLSAGFTQDLYGVADHFMGGVAFAPDGDPLVDHCNFSGSALTRFDHQGTEANAHGDELHPSTSLPSNAGCGLTNHPNGSLYSNTGSGVVRLNAETGAQIGSAFGPSGNALGIAPDPQTGNLIYVGSNGTLQSVNPALTATSTFSSETTGDGIDGIFFDQGGDFLFLADNGGVTIVNRAGHVVQDIATPTGTSDGIAFKATSPKFVVTNNTNGTMTRLDFANDDYSQVPTQSSFASGGFRGDLASVGADGCLYLTQDGIRFEDDQLGQGDSLVRLCGGFARPPGVGAEGPAGDPSCSDHVDNDGDGQIDGADSGCATGAAQPQQTAAARRDRSAPRVIVAGVSQTGCVRRAFRARFRIRESHLSRVSVYLDGKRIVRTSRALFSVRVNARRLRSGRHRIRVIAVDTSGNRRSLSKVFARCAQAQRVAPHFTG
jgi:hypothetical protein